MTVHEMDECLIARWNEKVGPKDVVYHLGDVGWGAPGRLRPLLDRLNGTIHLIAGNHDKTVLKPVCRSRFASVHDLWEIEVPDPEAPKGKQLIVLCHYAMRTWNKKHWGSWQLFGHTHGMMELQPNVLSADVGCDCWGYAPVSYSEVKEVMKRLASANT